MPRFRQAEFGNGKLEPPCNFETEELVCRELGVLGRVPKFHDMRGTFETWRETQAFFFCPDHYFRLHTRQARMNCELLNQVVEKLARSLRLENLVNGLERHIFRQHLCEFGVA